MSPEELKAQMMAAAEKVIEEMLAKKSEGGQVHLDEIEHLAVEAREAFGTVVVNELMKAEQEAHGAEGTACPGCGGKLAYRGHGVSRATGTGPGDGGWRNEAEAGLLLL
jgi:hypothetical protein